MTSRLEEIEARLNAIAKEPWDAANFKKWAESSGYKSGLQLDRINNDGDYMPSNCKWSTPSENCKNRRPKCTSPKP